MLDNFIELMYNRCMKKGIIISAIGVAILGIVAYGVKTLMECSSENNYGGDYDNCEFSNDEEVL